MDKRIILAVAGSGKTTTIIDRLDENSRSIIVTYTNNNFRNIRKRIIKKFGFFPSNIVLYTFFSFIYRFCYRPFLSREFQTCGINFAKNPRTYESQVKKGSTEINRDYYVDRSNRLYSNRISKLLKAKGLMDDVKRRLEKYFDYFYIDEVQDIAGNDYSFLKDISSANLSILLVGDFYQHTYDTSRDGNVNRNLFNDYDTYQRQFTSMKLIVDKSILKESYRCSPEICEFIRNEIGIDIYSKGINNSSVTIIDTQNRADEIFSDSGIIKLFIQEHYRYQCFSRNWGDSKGENDYEDVCVVMNKKTAELFNKHKLKELAPQTRNKFYVACSRPNGNLYLVDYSYYDKYKIPKKV